MDPDRWREARRILERVLEAPVEERDAILARECSDDEDLLREVTQLLAADGDLTGFLDPLDLAAIHTALPGVERGVRIGEFEVRRVLAAGGMGSVFEAHQEAPRRAVALKVMRWTIDAEAMRQRFRDEIEILGRMRHPAVAQVYGAGIHRGRLGGVECELPWFAMELVEDALPLTTYVQRHALDVAARLRLFRTVCEGVQHGHQRGIIHRDLKPGNLLVDGAGHPKVIDFGVARLVTEERRGELTRAGEVVGTLQYMSPEQLGVGGADVDTRSDVYALGVVLYELLVDAPPFDLARRSPAEAARILESGRYERPSARNPSCPPELDWVVARALEVDPERRYASASELRADVERFLAGEPLAAGPPTRGYRLRSFVRRHRVLVGAALAFLLALAIGLIVSLNLYLASERLRRDVAAQYAESERLRADLAEEYRASERLRDEIAEQLEHVREAERRATLEARSARDANEYFAAILGMASPGALGPEATILEAVHQASLTLGSQYAQDPERRALFQTHVGRVFLELGNLERAIPELRDALRVLREHFPADDERLIDLLLWLGRAATDARATDESRRWLDEAYALCTRSRGPDDPSTLRVRHQQGALLLMERDFAAAEEVLDDTLHRRRKVLGAEHESVQDTLELLATSALLRGEPDRAVSMIQETLLLRTRNLGTTHVATVKTMGTVVAFYRRAERWNELEDVIAPTLAICREVLGERHLTTSSVRQAKAALHERRGEHAEALAEWLSLEALRTEFVGEDHPSTMTAMRAVGNALLALGRLEEAAAQREKQLAILRRSAYGERHPATYLAWQELSDVLLRSGRDGEVVERLDGVVERARDDLPAPHEIQLRLQRNLVLGLGGAGHASQALERLAAFRERAGGDPAAAEFHRRTVAALVAHVTRGSRSTAVAALRLRLAW